MSRTILCAVVAMNIANLANASSIDFDFESETVGVFPSGVTFNSGGVDLTLTNNGGFIHVVDQFVPDSMGNQAIIGTQTSILNNFTPVTHTFSTDIASALFHFGDRGGDNDGIVSLQLLDSNNDLITTLSENFGTTAGSDTIVVNQVFRTAIFSTNSPPSNLHSLFQEWTDVMPVPEPTAATLGLIALGLGFARRRA